VNTGRFVTRQVDEIARVEILGADGQIETLEGTAIHPVWSDDRQDWVPLGELDVEETLQAADGVAKVLSIAIISVPVPVYNIEVHGEHVYRAGRLGVLVHNTIPDCVGWVRNQTMAGERLLLKGMGREIVQVPGYNVATFHHAFIRAGDDLFDVIHKGGVGFDEWVEQVAKLNEKSVDGIIEMIGKLPDDFR
jgi:hypothetical protein